MEAKARANLSAAATLAEHRLCDSATSRAYYAGYLAGWAWLASNGARPPASPDGRRYWPHATFAKELFNWGALADPDQQDDLDYLRGMRVKADYYIEPTTPDEADEAVRLARELIGLLLPDVSDG